MRQVIARLRFDQACLVDQDPLGLLHELVDTQSSGGRAVAARVSAPTPVADHHASGGKALTRPRVQRFVHLLVNAAVVEIDLVLWSKVELEHKDGRQVFEQDESHAVRQLVLRRREKRRRLVVEAEHDHREHTRQKDEREVGQRVQRENRQLAHTLGHVFGYHLQVEHETHQYRHVQCHFLILEIQNKSKIFI